MKLPSRFDACAASRLMPPDTTAAVQIAMVGSNYVVSFSGRYEDGVVGEFASYDHARMEAAFWFLRGGAYHLNDLTTEAA